ncbi:MAG TPA: methyltransferase domain-containing protein [Anaerolineales bacterium]|nr:methyltransferase domain-containing protein [Anaerolineales bacterium]
MPCSQCQGIEHEFGEREARAQLRRYRRRGPSGTTRELIEVLVRLGVEGCSVLDIGGGVGAVQHGLLAAGAGGARSVDASRAYSEIAREESERRGLTARIESTHGDFVSLAESITPADVVTLDRVLCCYHDVRTLVSASAARARRLYGLVYPRDVWWLRPAFALGNLILRLRRSSFRIFLHPTAVVERLIAAEGLRPTYLRSHGMWQVAVFRA